MPELEGIIMGRPLVPVKLDNYKPLREIVFEAIREAIINGDLKQGERLMETQLADEMGVSRTPVREAIRKLELEGFVVMIPRKGAYVAGLSLKDIVDVFEIRAALEALAGSLAAERMTDNELEELERLLVRIGECAERKDVEQFVELDTQFHDILFQASRNARLSQMINNLRDQIQRFRATSLAYPGRLKYAFDEHKKIVEALSERNSELVAILAKDHIESAENSFMDAFESHSDNSQGEKV
jgi:DNA-binding GntR family transcriptional regulator